MKYLIFISFILLFSCKKEKKIIIDSQKDALAEIFQLKPNWEGKLATIKIYKEDAFYASHQYFYGENGIPNGDIQQSYGGTIADSFLIEIKDTIVDIIDTFGNFTQKAIVWNNIKKFRNNELSQPEFISTIADNQYVYGSSGACVFDLRDLVAYNPKLFTTKIANQSFGQSVLDFAICPSGTINFQYPSTSFQINTQICNLKPVEKISQKGGLEAIALHTNFENKLGLMFNFMYGDYTEGFIPYTLFGVKVPNDYLLERVNFDTYRNSFEYKFNIENQLSELDFVSMGDISIISKYRAEFTYY